MFRLAVFQYGDQIENGAYDHPDGGTCALSIHSIYLIEDGEDALLMGINFEEMSWVHHVDVEEVP